MNQLLLKISLAFDNHRQIILLIVLGISISFALATLYEREIGYDDAWFAEEVYSFSENGYVKSELLKGLLRYDERHLTYHRLHIWQGVIAYKIFGWHPYIFKSMIAIYFLLFLLLVYFYIKKFKYHENNKHIFLVFYSLAIVHAVTLEHATIYRPDVFMMACGFVAFFLLHLSLKDNDWIKVFFSGLLSGACVLAHLNGLVFVAAGGMLLLVFKRYQLFFLFSVTAIIVCLLYFLEIKNKEMLDLFLYQFRHSEALSDKEFSIVGWVLKLLSIHGPYFRHPAEGAYTLLFLFVMWVQRKKIMANDNLRALFVYFFTIAIVLAVINPGAKTLYLTYHMPYAILLISILFFDIYSGSEKMRGWLLGLTVLYLTTQWGHAVVVVTRQTPGMVEHHRYVAEKLNLVKGEKIMAPMEFIFNEIDNYKIRSYIDMEGSVSIEKYFTQAKKDGRTTIILQKQIMENLGLLKYSQGEYIYGYYYQGPVGRYYAFKLADMPG